MKKFFALLLAATMLLSFVACGKGDNADSGNKGNVEHATADENTPDFFDGRELGDLSGDFHILVSGNWAWNDYEADENASSVVETAIYRRNQYIKEKYGAEITNTDIVKYSSTMGSGDGFKRVYNDYIAGQSTFDAAMIGTYDIASLAYNGLLWDLNSLPNINLSKSYWDQKANKDLSMNGAMFYTTGDISVADNRATYVLFFSKSMVEEYGLESPYDLVNDNKWTLEKFAEMVKKVGSDDNQDGVYDGNDRYGLLVWDDSITGIINAAGQRCCTVNDEGKLELTLYNETTLDALNQYTELAYDNQYALQYQRLNNSGPGKQWWQNNQGLFFTALVGEMPSYREMENDFGILPYPKLTEVQEKHYTTISPFNSQFICIPVVNSDIKRTGALTEALGYYGEKDITPALYDVTLKGQSARDSESSEMLDIIFDNLIYDIGYYYQVGPYNKQLIIYLRERNNAWASMYETYANAAQSTLDTINKAYDSAVALWK